MYIISYDTPAPSFATLELGTNNITELVLAPHASDIGKHRVMVMVEDNGEPPLDDFEVVTVTVKPEDIPQH